MGDAADLVLEAAEGEWFAREGEDLSDYSDDQLRAATARARDPKIKSIRAWRGPLSTKQRWCLIYWILDHEEN